MSLHEIHLCVDAVIRLAVCYLNIIACSFVDKTPWTGSGERGNLSDIKWQSSNGGQWMSTMKKLMMKCLLFILLCSRRTNKLRCGNSATEWSDDCRMFSSGLSWEMGTATWRTVTSAAEVTEVTKRNEKETQQKWADARRIINRWSSPSPDHSSYYYFYVPHSTSALI